MDKHISNSLIANSGLHFKTCEVTFNPEEPLLLSSGKTLKYTFLESVDYLNGGRIRVDVCAVRDGQYVPVNYLKDNNLLEEGSNGIMVLDEGGVPRIKKDTVMALVENYSSGSPELMNINSLSSFRVKQEQDLKIGFELLLGKWLPMPMYEEEISGQSTGYPNGWCRVRIDSVGERQKNGLQRYRLVWAFDTRLAVDMGEGVLRPAFLAGSGESKTYSLCNRVDLLFGSFLNIPDGQNEAPVGDYLVSLFGIDLREDIPHKYKFLAYYTYVINFLRLSGAAPTVTLYHKPDKRIPVDMSVDIGNSRTCAVLFERGDFTKARMLRLRDLSEPWRTYENAFDMRIVFRRADFGGDITFDKNLFQWQSLVRVGEEAKHLVYRAMENYGLSGRSTHCSSPKRYLWDNRMYEHRWELMVTDDDSTTLKVSPQIFIEGFTDHFDNDGTYLEEPKEIDLFSLGDGATDCHYSRQSLMTFVMIEMMQQAYCYINSSKFRDMHGDTDCARYLRNIVVTCPTAMPLLEQYALRRAAQQAAHLFQKLIPSLPKITIIPDPEKIHSSDDVEILEKRGWLYDEAFASQLVYLYAELAQRYGGRVDRFFQLKGHYRKEVADMGFEGNALTIGTIDIGAGTSDVMITSYGQKGGGSVTPIPLYYDSFYSAGDDILYNLIRDIILEGPDYKQPSQGSIGSALSTRIQAMSPDELLMIPRVSDTPEYRNAVEAIRHAMTEEDAIRLKSHLTQELMHHFFAKKTSKHSVKDVNCRLDFCTQVSHPMAQFFLELLKQGRPSKLYTYDELFPKEKPATYLLDHFAYHFGFRFEELTWRYDPEIVGRIVKDTMEPLVKALSVVMYTHHCDILVLSGRPTNLEPLTELFLKYIPIMPNRLVLLNQYRVGRWFPLATEEGYFQESQKAVVAVGAEVGYLASTVGFHGLVLDFSILSKTMKSTACYLGEYDEALQEVRSPFLTPENGTVSLKGISSFPYYIGCKQFNAPKYQARPLYAVYNHSSVSQLNLMLQRNYHEDRELITLEDVTDMQGETVSLKDVEIRLQTLANEGIFWMDQGAFTLKIQQKTNDMSNNIN